MTMSPAAERIPACPEPAFRWAATALPLPLRVLAGLVLLYLPIYLHLAATLWQQEEYGHAPLIALAVAFLFWRERDRLAALPPAPQAWPGALLFALGLLMAWLGQTQQVPFVATASQLPVLAGIVLVLHGAAGLRLVAFPLLFMLFMVQLPGLVIDALTLEMKEAISAAAVQLLHAAGYPIARSGVIIVIGQYQMLVADACSGLHSLISLAALGVLFQRLRPQQDRASRVLMFAAIVPVALAANFLRTLVLLLVTYHAGDVAARAWHETAGILLFLLALLLLSGLDALVARRGKRSVTS